MNNKDFFEDNLTTMNFLGEVLENNDPENLGRCKIRVFGKYDLLLVEDIPYAYPANNFTAGSATGGGFFSVPKIGSIINCYFDNNNIYHPIYTYHQKPSEELKTEIGEDNLNFHSLIYDTQLVGDQSTETDYLKIFYSSNIDKGLIINLKDTIVNIKNDNSFNVTNPNTDSIIMSNTGLLNITLTDIFTIDVTNEFTVNTITTNFNTTEQFNITTAATLIDTTDTITINTSTATITASTETIIDSPQINLGGGATEAVVLGDKLKSILSELIDGITALTVPTGTGPSLIPINNPTFISIKAKLQTILSTQNKTK